MARGRPGGGISLPYCATRAAFPPGTNRRKAALLIACSALVLRRLGLERKRLGDLCADIVGAADERRPPSVRVFAFRVEAGADGQGVQEQDLPELTVAVGLRADEAEVDQLEHVSPPRPDGPGARVARRVGAVLLVRDGDDALAHAAAPEVEVDRRWVAGLLARRQVPYQGEDERHQPRQLDVADLLLLAPDPLRSEEHTSELQ